MLLYPPDRDRRFLSIFYPPAIYQKYTVDIVTQNEHFFAGFKVLREQGYLKVAEVPGQGRKKNTGAPDASSDGNVLPAEKPGAAGDVILDSSSPEKGCGRFPGCPEYKRG